MAASSFLLHNGLIVDGTGNVEPFTGNLLISHGEIEQISENEINTGDGIDIIDCTGKVISPGFIDFHSHMDWYLTVPGRQEYKAPFTEQGVTTFIGGNCGFGTSAYKKNSPHMDKLENNLFKAGHKGITWNSLEDYYSRVEDAGLSHNLANLVGHGTTRTSIKGYDSSPMSRSEMDEMLELLENALDQGALGVSFGLQYEPGIFASYNEIKEIALLVKRKGKFISVHPRACSALSGTFPMKPFGKAHHILAIEEMIDLARETGVRLQFSHLIFVGKKTWRTYRKSIALFEKAVEEGLDVRFDTYGHHCGASIITAFLPDWFMAELPGACGDRKLLKKLKFMMNVSFRLLGFGYEDIQITYGNHQDLEEYNGMFLNEIAEKRGLSQFDNYIDFVAKSGGQARVLMYNYTNHDIMKELIKHPLSLYMTDAWIEPAGMQNPGAFASFPRIIEIARSEKLLPVEKIIHKMTGAAAERAGLKNRGLLKEGFAADITILDWDNVKDRTTPGNTGARPEGIEFVFINGIPVLEKGIGLDGVQAGKVLR
jgi:N-acyl-D-aspartate/D-glutamate deacylase